ncbi:cytosine methylase [Dunaliella viridis virus SI2]|uniref:cytosine methylase n=1 Tax=Dunaliella viridis virus SI2 TaxID=754069 RepID=UPI0002C0710E|nr:cytosine methylase [Dunaliella viridis virus SI2]AGH16026.1 cytosine methylase [Dunaliella viridis virus SI2]
MARAYYNENDPFAAAWLRALISQGVIADGRSTFGLADTNLGRSSQGRDATATAGHGHTPDANGWNGRPGPVNGVWRDADWLWCRDEKWRPVEPGLEPLVDGAPARVGRLRGYGNAIIAEQAAAFIQVSEEILNG